LGTEPGDTKSESATGMGMLNVISRRVRQPEVEVDSAKPAKSDGKARLLEMLRRTKAHEKGLRIHTPNLAYP